MEIRKKMEAAKSKLALLDKDRQQEFIKLEALKGRSSTTNEEREKQTGK